MYFIFLIYRPTFKFKHHCWYYNILIKFSFLSLITLFYHTIFSQFSTLHPATSNPTSYIFHSSPIFNISYMTLSRSRQNAFFLSSRHPGSGAHTLMTLNMLTSKTNLTTITTIILFITSISFVFIASSNINSTAFLLLFHFVSNTCAIFTFFLPNVPQSPTSTYY